jgi:hypothetical protein
MKSFQEFVTEERVAAPLKHLTHLEDLPIRGGHSGVGLAAEFLDGVHRKLLGHDGKIHVSEKLDGSPSLVFGTHPRSGQFFVATKSAFNSKPKINYTNADIHNNHGPGSGLTDKLKFALRHLPKIMPPTGGVYQGDVMHSSLDRIVDGANTSFTPNLITYSVPKDSAEGKKVGRSKFGIAIHTKYVGRGEPHQMRAEPMEESDHSKFQDHPDVHRMSNNIKINPSSYSPDEQREFLFHRALATGEYGKMKPETPDILRDHGSSIEAHVNDSIRNGKEPSLNGYINFLTDKSKSAVEKLKTESGRQRKAQGYASKIQRAVDNSKHFDSMLKLHGHLQKAKNVLVKVLGRGGGYARSIDGKPTAPEGVVATNRRGDSVKLVDRSEFSKMNFAKHSKRD